MTDHCDNCGREIAARDERIKFLEAQCDLLARRIDELEVEKARSFEVAHRRMEARA